MPVCHAHILVVAMRIPERSQRTRAARDGPGAQTRICPARPPPESAVPATPASRSDAPSRAHPEPRHSRSPCGDAGSTRRTWWRYGTREAGLRCPRFPIGFWIAMSSVSRCPRRPFTPRRVTPIGTASDPAAATGLRLRWTRVRPGRGGHRASRSGTRRRRRGGGGGVAAPPNPGGAGARPACNGARIPRRRVGSRIRDDQAGAEAGAGAGARPQQAPRGTRNAVESQADQSCPWAGGGTAIIPQLFFRS